MFNFTELFNNVVNSYKVNYLSKEEARITILKLLSITDLSNEMLDLATKSLEEIGVM